ncbi:hypothetical protein GCM10010393_15610 [Streptomyces gobitricini]|uniref:Uncharacterized protein n=1 Tax=Streptomyces gobitricini TaxID=68211 RepID=A0ABP5YR25_9ACTN
MVNRSRWAQVETPSSWTRAAATVQEATPSSPTGTALPSASARRTVESGREHALGPAPDEYLPRRTEWHRELTKDLRRW